MLRQILRITLILILAAGMLLLAAWIFIPDQVIQAGERCHLPALSSLQTATQPHEIRLYGTLEASTFHAMSQIQGRVTQVLVEQGDWVEQDQPLIQLDPTDAQAQIAAAQDALQAAQAARDAVAAPPSPEIRQVAESAVQAAQTELENARRQLAHAQDMLENPINLTSQIRQTAALIPVAQAQADAAQASIKQLDVLIQDAQADGSRQGKYRVQILQAQKQAAQANLDAANARIQGLRRTLALLKQIQANPLALQAQVHQAQAQVKVAEAALQVAKAERDLRTAPPQPEAVAVAEADVAQAQAALDLARWQAEQLTITAPAAGRVQTRLIHPGEIASPGQPLLTLADTRIMEVWVYVAAEDLHRVHLGDTLTVEVLALPDHPFLGQVFYIAPEAQFRPTNVLNPDDRGDMVFLVKLHLDNSDGILKPGMPADVILPLADTP